MFVAFNRQFKLGTAITVLVFWLMARALDTVLEMEGGLLLLLLASLLLRLPASRQCVDSAALGGLFGCCLLTRMELAIVLLVGAAFWYRSREVAVSIRKFTGSVAIVVVVHVACSLLLGVFPLPSTYWSKLMVHEARMFSAESFLQRIPGMLAELLFGVRAASSSIGVVAAVFLVTTPIVVFVFANRKNAMSVAWMLLTAATMFYGMPSNYIWYYQNLLIVVVVIACAAATTVQANHSWIARIAISIAVVLIALPLRQALLAERAYPWDFGRPSRAQGYTFIARHHLGQGKFDLSEIGVGHVYLRLCEIGIVSYFAGDSVWLWDDCGLAQVGNLRLAGTSPVRAVYSASVKRSALAELKTLNRESLMVYQAWSLRPEERRGAAGACEILTEIVCLNRAVSNELR